MNRTFLPIYIGIIGLLFPHWVQGQDTRSASQPVTLQVAGSALLAVSGPPVRLQLAGAAEAGDAIADKVDNSDSRLRISSLVNDGESRCITAKISEALVGTELYVGLEEPNAHFVYPENKGSLSAPKKLTNESEATLVEGIGTCWSGKEDGDGYIVKYTFKAIPNAPVLKSATITVTFTISSVTSDAMV